MRHRTPHPKSRSHHPPRPGGGKPPHGGRADRTRPDRSHVRHGVRLPPLGGPLLPTSSPGSAGRPRHGPYRRGHPPIPQHASTPEDPSPSPPHPARQLGRHGRPPGHHGGPHPQTPGHLVDSGIGRPQRGQTGNSTRPRRRGPATTTRRGPLATRRTRPPRPTGSLGSAALRPLLGAGGTRRPPPPRTHPSVDTPRHPLHGPHAPPRSRHRAPAPHLVHRPARRPAGGRGSALPHDQASVSAEGPRPHVQA